jgi:hypothetical protein
MKFTNFRNKKIKVKISGNWEILNTKIFKIKIENRKNFHPNKEISIQGKERDENEKKN